MTKSLGEAFTPFIKSVGDSVASHHALPPREKAIARAQLGTVLLVLAVYGWQFSKGLTGYRADEVMAIFMRSPSAVPPDLYLPLGVEGFAVLLGGVWVISGLRGSGGGPRNGMAAFWAALRIALYVGAMHWSEGGDWHPLVVLLTAPLLAADIVGLLLELRSGPRAKDIVVQQIEDAEIPWRPARGRRG